MGLKSQQVFNDMGQMNQFDLYFVNDKNTQMNKILFMVKHLYALGLTLVQCNLGEYYRYCEGRTYLNI